MHAHVHTHDAARVLRDPTRTGDLRRKFSADLRRRWEQVIRLMREAVVEKNFFGVGGHSAQSLMSGGSLLSFQGFVDSALNSVVIGDQQWVTGHVKAAYDRGVRRHGADYGDSARLHGDVALVELQGVCEAVSQQVVRAFADGLLRKKKATDILRTIVERIRKTGIERSDLLVQFSIVRAYNEAALDAMEQAGVSQVGIIPETIKIKLTTDAPTRASRERLRTQRRERRAAREGLVNIETAGDDRVCPRCEDLEEEGPYDIETARGLIPVHPRCRCAFTPFVFREEIFEDAWDPDKHPRHPSGSSQGGEFSSKGGSAISEKELTDNFKPVWNAFTDKNTRNSVRSSTKRWIGLHFTEINAVLRNDLNTGSRKILRDIKNLDALFDVGGHDLKENIKVWRGLDRDLGLSVGDEFVDYGFVATSPIKEFAYNFTGARRSNARLMEIQVPRGTRVVSPMMRNKAGHLSEPELLLKRRTRFKVIEIMPNGTIRVRVML